MRINSQGRKSLRAYPSDITDSLPYKEQTAQHACLLGLLDKTFIIAHDMLQFVT
jgi:hypothetical protein